MLIVDAHNAAHADSGDQASPRPSTKNPYSLDGLPQGNAGDLIEIAKTVNAVRRQDGSVVKP